MTFPTKVAAAALAFTFFAGSVANAGWFRDRSNSRNNHCCPSPCSTTSYGHTNYGHGGYVTQQPYYSTGHSYGASQVQHVATDCGCATATPASSQTYYRGDSYQQSQGEWSEGVPTEARTQPGNEQRNWQESEQNNAANSERNSDAQRQDDNSNRTDNRNSNSQERNVEDAVENNVDSASDAASEAADSDSSNIEF